MSSDPLGNPDRLNLYAFCRNPWTFVDSIGLGAQKKLGKEEAFLSYFHRELQPHCYWERHRDLMQVQC